MAGRGMSRIARNTAIIATTVMTVEIITVQGVVTITAVGLIATTATTATTDNRRLAPPQEKRFAK